MEAFAIELLKLVPDLLWFALAVALVAAFWQPIRNDLLPNLTNLKAGGVELSFVREALDRAIELAEKSPKWPVHVPQRNKEQVLRRARRHLGLLAGSAVLWLDDDHANNRNELRMLRQLKVEVETVSTTEEALARLDRDKFNVVLSGRAPAPDPRRIGAGEWLTGTMHAPFPLTAGPAIQHGSGAPYPDGCGGHGPDRSDRACG
jgi:hypothetical protein